MANRPHCAKRWHRVNGFTAVEAVVTVALLIIVFVMSTPFAEAWLSKARVSEAQSTLQKAVVIAKRSATEAALPLSHAAPVSVICLAGNRLQVKRVVQDIQLGLGQKPCEHSVLLWQTELNANVEALYVNDQQSPVLLSEMHFNSQGQLVSEFCRYAQMQEHCATGNRLMVSAGSAQVAEVVTL